MELTEQYHNEGCLWQNDKRNVWTVLNFFQVPTVELVCVHTPDPEQEVPNNLVLSRDNSEWNKLSPLVKKQVK